MIISCSSNYEFDNIIFIKRQSHYTWAYDKFPYRFLILFKKREFVVHPKCFGLYFIFVQKIFIMQTVLHIKPQELNSHFLQGLKALFKDATELEIIVKTNSVIIFSCRGHY